MRTYSFVFLCLTYFTYTMPSRSIHVVANGRISIFLWLNSIPSSLSIHLSMNTYLVPISQLWLITLQWTRGCSYLFKIVICFPLEVYPAVELLDHIVILFLIFWGTAKLFSIVATPVYIPNEQYTRVPFTLVDFFWVRLKHRENSWTEGVWWCTEDQEEGIEEGKTAKEKNSLK